MNADFDHDQAALVQCFRRGAMPPKKKKAEKMLLFGGSWHLGCMWCGALQLLSTELNSGHPASIMQSAASWEL
jgi:hypothetical protein